MISLIGITRSGDEQVGSLVSPTSFHLLWKSLHSLVLMIHINHYEMESCDAHAQLFSRGFLDKMNQSSLFLFLQKTMMYLTCKTGDWASEEG